MSGLAHSWVFSNESMKSTIACSRFANIDDPCHLPLPPFYYSPRPELVQGVSDHIMALAAPIIAYWVLSMFFHVLDISNWQWLDKYRIHESREVQSRNRATRTEVVWAVIAQQVIQTALGLYWMSDSENSTAMNHSAKMQALARTLEHGAKSVLGVQLMGRQAEGLSHFIYWWGFPGLQLLFAMFLIDTWQYFLHRLMHVNKFMYRHFHSWHHRLYVPYAFGSLYNHPFEGFLLDSLGAVIAESLSGMTTRQAMLLFTFSTMKTVDDHCGYNFPLDPFQMMSGNNADYHDIHHQVIGIKANFSQPFFVHWDYFLGTRMTRDEVDKRRRKVKQKMI